MANTEHEVRYAKTMESKFKRHFESFDDNESWDEYCHRLNIPHNEAQRYFYRHVIFDHYDDFDRRFPWFNAESFAFDFENWEGTTIHELVKYDGGQEIDWWYSHVEQNQPIGLLKYMLEHLTWPVPIVLFDFFVFPMKDGSLSPAHLIEGTHRVSYLKKLMMLGKIQFKSHHAILVLRPKN